MKLATRICHVALFASFLIAGCPTVQAEWPPETRAVILFIGDGMGLNITTAADIYSRAVYCRSLFPNNIATHGISSTQSANSGVTDSAAAATALLSGYKTNNQRVNVLPDNRAVHTIPRAAKEKGLAVGVVSTTRLTHATPAAMYGHSVSRDSEQLLADQFLGLSPDVALGGGLQYFLPSTESRKSKRTDQRDITAEARLAGYTFVSTADELQSTRMANVRKLLGLFADSHMSYEIDRLNEVSLRNHPSLSKMTKAALDVVKTNPRGFFLMIEGGRIDHACHGHDIKAAIYDVIAFNDAVEVALEFQKVHPDVLIVVTADHETGGLGLGRGTEYGLNLMALKPIRTSIELFNKKYAKNRPETLFEFLKASGFDLTEQEKQLVMKQPLDGPPQASDDLRSHGRIDRYIGSWLGYALSKIESDRAKVGWTSFVHTAAPVITYAVGPGEKCFSGTYDNTDIARNIFRILGLKQKEPSL